MGPSAAGLARGIYSGRAGRGGSFGGGPAGRGGGTTRQAESTVNAGLIWLQKAQSKDGHWSCKDWDGGADYDVGMTGLALLAYLGAGYTHTKGPYKDTVKGGLEWLRAQQHPNGSFPFKTFYEQGIAAMAVSEAYGMTQSPAIGRMAQKAVDYICQVQPEHGGFRYAGAVPKDQGDMSVTAGRPWPSSRRSAPNSRCPRRPSSARASSSGTPSASTAGAPTSSASPTRRLP